MMSRTHLRTGALVQHEAHAVRFSKYSPSFLRQCYRFLTEERPKRSYSACTNQVEADETEPFEFLPTVQFLRLERSLLNPDVLGRLVLHNPGKSTYLKKFWEAIFKHVRAKCQKEDAGQRTREKSSEEYEEEEKGKRGAEKSAPERAEAAVYLDLVTSLSRICDSSRAPAKYQRLPITRASAEAQHVMSLTDELKVLLEKLEIQPRLWEFLVCDPTLKDFLPQDIETMTIWPDLRQGLLPEFVGALGTRIGEMIRDAAILAQPNDDGATMRRFAPALCTYFRSRFGRPLHQCISHAAVLLLDHRALGENTVNRMCRRAGS